MNNKVKGIAAGLAVTALLGIFSRFCAGLIPMDLISAGVFAMLVGMLLYKPVQKIPHIEHGLKFVSKTILKTAIVLMGATLSFSQVLDTGKFSLFVMVFTLAAAFGFGNLFGKLFRMNWKLSNLISAGTGICGGTAIAAISPVIDADDSDVAYAISATFIFDILMVILFPIAGRAFGMTDLGYGLWAGTAVNDTSSVVAAGYAYSDAAGQFATIVKLTRTLSIVPIVLIFAYANQAVKARENGIAGKRAKISMTKIFPWFVLLFLGFVFLRSVADNLAAANLLGLTPENVAGTTSVISKISKFAMVMALGAIGLKTDFKKMTVSGFKPMLHGFIISALVVVVSFFAQLILGQI